jgi:hypothetical protein
MKADVAGMPKNMLTKHLKSRGLNAKGSHEVLQTRLLKTIQDDHDAHIEQREVEHIAWEEGQGRSAEEEVEKEAALAHLTRVNAKYAKLKALTVRKQLAKCGMKTTGKKAKLLERLATALEESYEEK